MKRIFTDWFKGFTQKSYNLQVSCLFVRIEVFHREVCGFKGGLYRWWSLQSMGIHLN